ncbi:hypothetical protein [Rhodococcus opacus]|uniref:hypothetical protein n=1 Tax=Rhodococcus opacus TaxID=37919 RepID=UPI001C4656BA|nr:hypothetical protein [Rhodococcus opacus]MBV6758008.1 hypothetical protein [Rhodococcus opacus]
MDPLRLLAHLLEQAALIDIMAVVVVTGGVVAAIWMVWTRLFPRASALAVHTEVPPIEDHSDPGSYPSLELIEGYIERTVDSQERRVTSMDQRGGVLLGFAGVIVGLVFRDIDHLHGWGIVGGVLAVLAGALAGAVIFPGTANTLSPVELLEGYALEDPAVTRFNTLSTLADLFKEEEGRVRRKGQLLQGATLLLPLAVLVLFIGAILNY